MLDKESGGKQMTNSRIAPKPVIHWLTLATIMVALAIAAAAQASDGLSELAGGHAGPAPEGTGEIALIGEPKHECDLGLRIAV